MKRLKRLMTIMDSMNDKVHSKCFFLKLMNCFEGTRRHGCVQNIHEATYESVQNRLWGWGHGNGGIWITDWKDLLKYFMPYGNCRLLPNIRKGYKFCTPISKVHALLDQFKKFSGVVKQMGGVKELFKDEKQVKNLNPQKMGKVRNT